MAYFPYAGAIMNRWTRRVLYTLFVLGFFMVAPAVVLYTAGFRINWKTARIVQTGLISVSTLPRSAEISIDGRLIGSRTPSVIDAIPAGAHEVLLKKSGYFPWERTLSVVARQTVFLEGIPLFLTAPATKIESGFIHAGAATIGTFIVARTEAGWVELWTLNEFGENKTLLSRIPALSASDLALSFHPEGHLLRIHTKTETTFVRIDTGLTASFHTSLAAEFDPTSESRIFVHEPKTLVLVDLESETRRTFPVGVKAAMGSGSGFLILESSPSGEAVSRLEGTTITPLAVIPRGTWSFEWAPSGYALLKETGTRRVILLDARGSDRPILFSSQTSLTSWSPDAKFLATNGDGHELNVYSLEKNSSETLTRVSSELREILWLPSGAAIIYADDHAVTAIETVSQEGRATFKLFEGSATALGFDRRARELWFFRTNGDQGVYRRALQ